MKKISVILASLVLFAGVSFASPRQEKGKEKKVATKEKKVATKEKKVAKAEKKTAKKEKAAKK
ncbi:MAG: histone [Bacteroidia bacterium]|nr:histone [Bacteroidia bacterium]